MIVPKQTLTDLIKLFQHENGVVAKFFDQTPDTPHYFLNTALYLDLCTRIPTEYDTDTDQKFDDFKYEMEIVSGLYRPGTHDLLKPIEWCEIVAIASSDTSRAKKIYEYGLANKGCFDNRVPYDTTNYGKKSNDLVTMPFYKARSGLKLNIIEKLKWVIGAIKLVTTNEYVKLAALNLMLKHMKKQESWLLNLTVGYIQSKLNKRFEDLSGLYKNIYYAQHPLTIFSKGVKF